MHRQYNCKITVYPMNNQACSQDVRIQLPDPLLGVEPLALEHLHGDVDDAGPEAGGLQMGGDRHEAHRIHLEHGRRRDDVAHGAVEYGLLTEIVHAGRMEEDNV